jgi:hypothetical protein
MLSLNPRARFADCFQITLRGRPRPESERGPDEPRLPWLIVDDLLRGKEEFTRDELLAFYDAEPRPGLALLGDGPTEWPEPERPESAEAEAVYLGSLFLADWLHTRFNQGGEWLDVWQEAPAAVPEHWIETAWQLSKEGYSQAQIAQHVGKTREYVNRKLKERTLRKL